MSSQPPAALPASATRSAGAWTVVWDLGGVMLEWVPREVVRRSLPGCFDGEAELAALEDVLFEDFAVGTDWSEFDRGTVTQAELVTRMSARSGVAPELIDAMIDGIAPALHRRPDSLALAHRLREAGHRVLFLSNMPLEISEGLDADPAFRSAFDDGLYSSRMGLVKPEPEIFVEAARRFGLPADGRGVVYLDDRAVNLAAPLALGWTCLLFTDAARAEADLRRLGLVA